MLVEKGTARDVVLLICATAEQQRETLMRFKRPFLQPGCFGLPHSGTRTL